MMQRREKRYAQINGCPLVATFRQTEKSLYDEQATGQFGEQLAASQSAVRQVEVMWELVTGNEGQLTSIVNLT
ncbi:hypothetical protein [Janthinobacterium sp. 1_2014MBL_MicDiv]|uniref:hypothetical protein n=1 Tax=Janthinobacterium sp. 1_2014MBL_MicDiv TaxID=1644131 RepID=UPI0008F4EE5B|nr:hypothetical protein [Janthinobacterium sp. 1_2014MBL_MicDiv]APA68464.1 hypothetical protein YQ44_12245 [Janthinobacterium sp. 1_2014MBL_MicDiv]